MVTPRIAAVPVPRLMCAVTSDDNLRLLTSLVDVGVDAFQVCDATLRPRELATLTQRVMAASGVVVIVRGRLVGDLPVVACSDLAPDDRQEVAAALAEALAC